jgi:hypothetical protein
MDTIHHVVLLKTMNFTLKVIGGKTVTSTTYQKLNLANKLGILMNSIVQYKLNDMITVFLIVESANE